MKKTLAISLALLALAFAVVALMPRSAGAADEFKWFDKLEDGIAEARKSGKPIFLCFR
ncbi:MAG: hypothetical protein KBG84_09960 [Planctomycetes bacterium]|nr:hypothetical protein [Planctomycetota bacterium]